MNLQSLPATPGQAAKQPRASPVPAGARKPFLPSGVFRYVFETSALLQFLMVLLTVIAFLLELVPLELQRRIVNDLVKHRQFRAVVGLAAVYAGIVLVQGGTKLVLNVFRSWVGESATRDLRRRIRGAMETSPERASSPEANAVEVSMIVAEVEPIGGFVGEAVSEPLLQAGILATVTAYMIHIEPWMGAAALAIFSPQLILVPLMQHAINRRAGARIQILREISISVVTDGDATRGPDDEDRINRAFELNMGIFRLKFSMNFFMNFCSQLQVVAALLIGGWYVYTDRLVIGGVVAFISAVGRLNDPWGDLVNYFRDMSVTQVKFRMVADVLNRLP
jgi:ABC-type bacteriocin/lantibiotic exporter with double-glycine peptidase domain